MSGCLANSWKEIIARDFLAAEVDDWAPRQLVDTLVSAVSSATSGT